MITPNQTGEQLRFLIGESSQVAEVRRKVTALAGGIGLDENLGGICALIASEMGTNLIKHAKEGELLLRTIQHGSAQGVEILALDRGPGIANVGHALQDGHSTAGSCGNGLGAIERMASEFDIHSLPGRGTSLVARVWDRVSTGAQETPRSATTGVVCQAKAGETVSGDAWLADTFEGRILCAVVDGLGHGPQAAKASMLAIESLREHRTSSLTEQVEFAHGALRSTRGAALGVAQILPDQGIVKFVGIGNIMAAVQHHGTVRNMVSQNGILGHQVRRVTEFQYPWSESDLLVMCSDGITTHWDMNQYAGLTSRDPSLIAATLYRDFTRGRDDTTVIATKMSDRSGPNRPAP